MAELRAGGLAIIIGGNPESIGTVVVVVKFVPAGVSESLPNGKKINNGGSGRWLINSDKICVQLADGSIMDDWALCFSHHLMPIDGDSFQHEGEKQKELTHG
ncbi:hypothetical protein [Serratia entomophila]|uniref:hypothetical protein n=1 Tax=Serratia entomophila TaxID=42906 RepID=UPI00217CBAD3|nr:hypothetical protein [Serratia entomophila]CAI0819135.1 Uncharacterised protein [Serratia entomophila]CAI0842740.1 Uncharacterised protein [Serratia entomophila]CAI0878817.1 Uncharacterised protein [Serratia entomophila]CAI1782042.1 Uncharacterised protein [Serratia entomophila]CAI1952715.1 Uncharacterised protein [Serratia entomophila]